MRLKLLDTLLLWREGFALRGNTPTFKLKLLNPSAQNGLGDADGAACVCVAVILINDKCSSIAFELRGKRTTLFAHQTPLHGEHFRLNECPEGLDHYITTAFYSGGNVPG
ncbi:hypothetical protein PAP18089_03518 [Pandoraea apista]|uniref:Uncharacterized protein n=1 Tax=Pandoraea apista TaxID=93218 RepID=A0A5E5P7N0_9BURK|nr:hypothetical protein PAP18089_03518 [Pandoraea apista]